MSESRPARSQLDALADAWEAAWVGHAHASFTDCCTGDVQYEDPVTREPLMGVEALTAQARRLWHMLPDVRVEGTGQRVGSGRFGCFPWRLLGTHRGDLATLPASGRFVTLQGVHYVEIADGEVRRARGFYDLYDLGVQLGVLPARGGIGETAFLLLRGFGLRPRA